MEKEKGSEAEVMEGQETEVATPKPPETTRAAIAEQRAANALLEAESADETGVVKVDDSKFEPGGGAVESRDAIIEGQGTDVEAEEGEMEAIVKEAKNKYSPDQVEVIKSAYVEAKKGRGLASTADRLRNLLSRPEFQSEEQDEIIAALERTRDDVLGGDIKNLDKIKSFQKLPDLVSAHLSKILLAEGEHSFTEALDLIVEKVKNGGVSDLISVVQEEAQKYTEDGEYADHETARREKLNSFLTEAYADVIDSPAFVFSVELDDLSGTELDATARARILARYTEIVGGEDKVTSNFMDAITPRFIKKLNREKPVLADDVAFAFEDELPGLITVSKED